MEVGTPSPGCVQALGQGPPGTVFLCRVDTWQVLGGVPTWRWPCWTGGNSHTIGRYGLGRGAIFKSCGSRNEMQVFCLIR